jgi:Zn-dependent peptidase ImmA (M78 family)
MIAERLNFVLEWIDEVAGEPVSTMARFAIEVEGDHVWPTRGASTGGLEIYVDDLLSHLTEFWQPLLLRQNYPLPLDVDRPSQLRPEAEKAWGALPEDQVDPQEDAVAAFEQAHNLAISFGGQFDLPRLWLFRQGQHWLIETNDLLIQAEFSLVVMALSGVGDKIAERLQHTGDGRWSRLIRSWRERDRADPEVLLMWSTGLPRESARSLLQSGILRPASSVSEAANDDDELRIAARMTGVIPIAEIERLLRRASQIAPRDTPGLDQLSEQATVFLNSQLRERQPFEQGVALARFARESLRLGDYDRVDPLRVFFFKNKIYLEFEELGLANLDAIAIWGHRHGPGVLVNKSSRRLELNRRENVAGHGAARVTIAHELCHLLVDRGRALGAVDILNGRMPLAIEQRARAFAAALMLPAEAAAQTWREMKPEISKEGVSSVLRRLTRRFGVTTSIAAWQLVHGLPDEMPTLGFLLDQIAPRR